jgi:hypothetical protein
MVWHAVIRRLNDGMSEPMTDKPGVEAVATMANVDVDRRGHACALSIAVAVIRNHVVLFPIVCRTPSTVVCCLWC